MTDQTIAGDRLRSMVERIERLQEQKRELADDIKDIYAEAKSGGFDVKALRRVIAERRIDVAALEEHETLKALYRRALGQLSDTPLGDAAVAAVTPMRRRAAAH